MEMSPNHVATDARSNELTAVVLGLLLALSLYWALVLLIPALFITLLMTQGTQSPFPAIEFNHDPTSFSSAILAGILAGLAVSLLYQFTTVPLIMKAEEFENKQSADARYATGTDKFVVHLVHNSDPKSNHPEWEPASFVERIVYTSLTTIISGVGFALLIVSALVIRGSSGGFRIGVLWGIGGFAAFILAPAVGLPPELPGMMKAELIGRQLWWLGTAIVTATGYGY